MHLQADMIMSKKSVTTVFQAKKLGFLKKTAIAIVQEPKKFDWVGRRVQKKADFWLFLAPPADPVEFLWFKMASTEVLHIVLHVSC